MVGDPRIDQLGAERLEPAERPFLVGFDAGANSPRHRPRGSLRADVRRESALRAPWRLLGGGGSYTKQRPARIKHQDPPGFRLFAEPVLEPALGRTRGCGRNDDLPAAKHLFERPWH